MHRMALSLCSVGLSHAWVRIQLRHAAPASQFLTVFASAGAVFQTNDSPREVNMKSTPLFILQLLHRAGLNTSPSLLTR